MQQRSMLEKAIVLKRDLDMTFIQMIGIPGSGKTEKARALAKEHNAVLLSSDAIREEIFGDALYQTKNNDVFEVMYKRTCEALSNGRSVIYDATNINHKRRRVLLQQLKAHYDMKAIAVVMATPIQMCIDRQANRNRQVGKDVIWQMVRGFYMPYWYEGWDDIEICYPENKQKYIHQLYRSDIQQLIDKSSLLYEYDQKNPYHQLSLGEHMRKCHWLICGRSLIDSLQEAALLHDIGKFYTQSFDENDVAHYYDHQNVSAYLSLFSRHEDKYHIISRAAYIQWHMAPYFWKEEKTHNKYKRLFGDQFYEDLMMLHSCDKEAH